MAYQQPYYQDRNGEYAQADGAMSVNRRVSATMKRVYAKMFIAMLVSALVAWLCSSSASFMAYYATHSWLMWGVVIAEFALVIGISRSLGRMSASVASLLFYLFAAVNGLMLAPILIVYAHAAIYKTFVITAAVFGAMSIYGFFTNSDLTKWGQFLIYALIGLFICMIINIFWANSTMEWIINIAGVLIFVGLTAWDTQQVKQLAASMPDDSVGRLATIGALNLYLDFINLFLFLLQIFGGGNND